MEYECYPGEIFDAERNAVHIKRRSSAVDDAHVRFHWHSYIELLYAFRNDLQIFLNGSLVCVPEGCLCVVNRNVVHQVFAGDANKSAIYYYFWLDERILAQLGLSAETRRYEIVVRDPIIRRHCDDLTNEYEASESYSNLAVLQHALAIYLRLFRDHQSATAWTPSHDSASLAPIQSALSYIQTHVCEHISLDDLCQACCVSRYYLCRTFKRCIGHTVIDYINMLKCASAFRLLSNEGRNVTETAYRCGFSNLSYFTRVYTRYMGHPPSEDALRKPPPGGSRPARQT